MNRETMHHGRRVRRGFNIIELMIVVVILGILAGIAFPSYSQYVARSHRRAAQAAMTEIANRQQQIFMATRAYADKATLEANGYGLPADVSSRWSYDVTPQDNPPRFTITFTAIGSQTDYDSTLTLDETGKKLPAGKW